MSRLQSRGGYGIDLDLSGGLVLTTVYVGAPVSTKGETILTAPPTYLGLLSSRGSLSLGPTRYDGQSKGSLMSETVGRKIEESRGSLGPKIGFRCILRHGRGSLPYHERRLKRRGFVGVRTN